MHFHARTAAFFALIANHSVAVLRLCFGSSAYINESKWRKTMGFNYALEKLKFDKE